ncbi:MAG: hypothetical protein JXR95_10620 [Deltaproteobacteria bacterium]|nr:hypothetical protein [Deltaproteobacteria bacterium]
MFLIVYIYLSSIQLTALSTPGKTLGELGLFERAEWCRKMAKNPDVKKYSERILKPFSYSQLEDIRNLLQMKGAKLPSPTGFFMVPNVKIDVNQVRKDKNKSPQPLDLLLSSSKYTDESRNAAIEELLTRGCMIKALFSLKSNPEIPEILLKAAFHPPTMIFRDLISSGLQKMGGIVVLSLYGFSRKVVNRERNKPLFYRVRYARYIINSSEAGNPRFALQAEKSMKLKLMSLYGDYQVSQAIETLLVYANSDDEEDRSAARKALMKYFESPRKKATVGTIKLPGGAEKKAVLYISARQQAYHAVKRILEEITKGDYDRTSKSADMARQLFSAWDKRRKSKWKYAFADAWVLDQNGEIPKAVEIYRDILANDPDFPQRKLMTAAFLKLARHNFSQGKISSAMNLYRVVVQLDAQPEYEADLFYILGLTEESTGDLEQARFWYRMALRRNPEHLWARGALHSLDTVPLIPVEIWELSTLIGGFFFMLGMMVLYTVRRRF